MFNDRFTFGGHSDINWLPCSLRSSLMADASREFLILMIEKFPQCHVTFNGVRTAGLRTDPRRREMKKNHLTSSTLIFRCSFFGEKSRSTEHFSVVPLHTLRYPIVILIKQQQSKRCETFMNKKKYVRQTHSRNMESMKCMRDVKMVADWPRIHFHNPGV